MSDTTTTEDTMNDTTCHTCGSVGFICAESSAQVGEPVCHSCGHGMERDDDGATGWACPHMNGDPRHDEDEEITPLFLAGVAPIIAYSGIGSSWAWALVTVSRDGTEYEVSYSSYDDPHDAATAFDGNVVGWVPTLGMARRLAAETLRDLWAQSAEDNGPATLPN